MEQQIINKLSEYGYSVFKKFETELLKKIIFKNSDDVKQSSIIFIVIFEKYCNICLTDINLLPKEFHNDILTDNTEIIVNGVVYNGFARHLPDGEIITLTINGLSYKDLFDYLQTIFEDNGFEVTYNLLTV